MGSTPYILPDGTPRTRMVLPKLAVMDSCIERLDAVLLKLVRLILFFPEVRVFIENAAQAVCTDEQCC